MRARTKQLGLSIVNFVARLPKGRVQDVLARQLLRSGTSVGANYREALGASSRKHFISTMEIAQREADETCYWLELIEEGGLADREKTKQIHQEATELLAILKASVRTAKQTQNLKKTN